MKDSNKIIEVDTDHTNSDNITITSKKSYYVLPYYSNSKFVSGKEYTAFLKSVEKEVRTSDEYAHYLGYLKGLGLDKCAFLNNIDDDMATIEFHHYPFNLYEICDIVTNYRLAKGEQVSTFNIAKEVIECHFKNIIGLVPLSKTVHELFHSGQIFINLNMVFGRFNEFVTQYSPLFPEYIKELNRLIDMSDNNTTYSETDILQKK